VCVRVCASECVWYRLGCAEIDTTAGGGYGGTVGMGEPEQTQA
jgi:hypothetical protein